MTNFRRRFIRSCFILPVILCVLGWLISGLFYGQLRYNFNGRYFCCGTACGLIILETGEIPGAGWEYCNFESFQEAHFWPHANTTDIMFLGFGFDRPLYGINAKMVLIPYWFLILAFSILLFLIWRKTRPQLSPTTAFPMKTITIASSPHS